LECDILPRHLCGCAGADGPERVHSSAAGGEEGAGETSGTKRSGTGGESERPQERFGHLLPLVLTQMIDYVIVTLLCHYCDITMLNVCFFFYEEQILMTWFSLILKLRDTELVLL